MKSLILALGWKQLIFSPIPFVSIFEALRFALLCLRLVQFFGLKWFLFLYHIYQNNMKNLKFYLLATTESIDCLCEMLLKVYLCLQNLQTFSIKQYLSIWFLELLRLSLWSCLFNQNFTYQILNLGWVYADKRLRNRLLWVLLHSIMKLDNFMDFGIFGIPFQLIPRIKQLTAVCYLHIIQNVKWDVIS